MTEKIKTRYIITKPFQFGNTKLNEVTDLWEQEFVKLTQYVINLDTNDQKDDYFEYVDEQGVVLYAVSYSLSIERFFKSKEEYLSIVKHLDEMSKIKLNMIEEIEE